MLQRQKWKLIERIYGEDDRLMLVYLICYIVSFILAWQHIYVLSGLVLLGAALWLYIKDYMRTGNLIHLRGLFCLFFVGGQGSPALSFPGFRLTGRL